MDPIHVLGAEGCRSAPPQKQGCRPGFGYLFGGGGGGWGGKGGGGGGGGGAPKREGGGPGWGICVGGGGVACDAKRWKVWLGPWNGDCGYRPGNQTKIAATGVGRAVGAVQRHCRGSHYSQTDGTERA